VSSAAGTVAVADNNNICLIVVTGASRFRALV
jgi:hypothetical protein